MASLAFNHQERDDDIEHDEDAVFEALEKEVDAGYHRRRIKQLQMELTSQKDASRSTIPVVTTLVNNSVFPTLPDDQTLLDFATQSARCVVHFFHPDFARCAVMNRNLRLLATEHHEVRFARVDARHVPFVAGKLKVVALPCVIGFKDGIEVERVVGFEGLGQGGMDADSTFETIFLERRFVKVGVLTKVKVGDREPNGGGGETDEEAEACEKKNGKSRSRSGKDFGRSKLGTQNDEDNDDWE
jgi:hypothetical protein